MEKTYICIKEGLNDADVQLVSDTVKVLFKGPVMFEFNKAEISTTIFPSFERFSSILNKKDKTTIMIAGHTDSIGGDNTNNIALSLRRADSAKRLLTYYKIAPSRIYTWGMGAKEPLASNTTDDGRALNRRIEFIVLYNLDKEKH